MIPAAAPARRRRPALTVCGCRALPGSSVLARLRALFADLCLDSADNVVRLLGPFLIALAAAIVAASTLAFLRHVAPFYGARAAAAASLARMVPSARAGDSPPLLLVPFVLAHSLTSTCLALAWLFVAGQLVFNYGVCVLCDPGFAPAAYREQLRLLSAYDPASAAQTPQHPREVPACRHCGDAPKPRRVHHCSVCGRCVAKMDHHCPWLSNCVGARTYPYFLRLLMWTWVGCAFMTAAGLPPFLEMRLRCGGVGLGGDTAGGGRVYSPGLAGAAGSAGGRLLLSVAPLQAALSEHTRMQLQLEQERTQAPGQWAEGNGGGPRGAAAPWPSVYVDFAGLWRWLVAAARFLHARFILDAPGPHGCNHLLPLAWVLLVATGLPVAALLAWHGYLVATAQTSLEFLRNREAQSTLALADAARLALRARMLGRPPSRFGCAGACLAAAWAWLRCCCACFCCGCYGGGDCCGPSLPSAWKNPFDFGRARNIRAVFGTGSLLLMLLPPSWVGLPAIGDRECLRNGAEPDAFVELAAEMAAEVNRLQRRAIGGGFDEEGGGGRSGDEEEDSGAAASRPRPRGRGQRDLELLRLAEAEAAAADEAASERLVLRVAGASVGAAATAGASDSDATV